MSDQKIRVYTFLEGEVLTKLDEQAAFQGLSRSELVRTVVEQYLTRAGGGGEGDITTRAPELITLKGEVYHLQELIQAKDSEILHLRGLTLDLRSLADNLASRMPALPPGQMAQEEAKRSRWKFWKRG